MNFALYAAELYILRTLLSFIQIFTQYNIYNHKDLFII